ncbi:MAG: hypothetical protein NZ740_10280 [Kiritimatiellae bacterium]|nr:hypothetical protein [Kiritimatiellia bacterium]MDW8459475.1 hypothetical protein [Verrucomicrobiota bacterium]
MMMKRLTVIFASLFAAVALWVSSGLNAELRDARREEGISQADPLINAPPLVAFTTVALGGFRGIVADILWLRSARLQEEGRYFELVQLADWITKLEPRFTSIWAFHAWNLAYNISVLLESPEERWRWVRHGISLLRDEGLRYNPGDARLLYELGWLFQHKVGGEMDRAHMYYKRAWAAEMEELWRGRAPDFEALARAAPSRAELMARPGVAQLVSALQAEGRQPFSYGRIAEAEQAQPGDPLRSNAGRELVEYLRRQRMVEDYKLDPLAMREIEETYGPLDWRLPQAHSLYWAWHSRRVAKREFDKVAAERMIFHSVADAFRQGNLFWDRKRDLFILSPNPDLAPRVQAAYAEALAKFPGEETLRTAHANFLREALVIRFIYNQEAEARALFEELRSKYPEEAGTASFEAFVQEQFVSRHARLSARDARAIVEGALFQSEFWRAAGDERRAMGYAGLARLTWEQHQRRISTSPDLQARLALPPLEELRRLARERVEAELHP